MTSIGEKNGLKLVHFISLAVPVLLALALYFQDLLQTAKKS